MNDRWTDRLSEYLDGDLAETDCAQVETHLESCAECRAVLAELRGVVAGAREAVEVLPAVDLWPAIAARIRVTPQLEAETAAGAALAEVPATVVPTRGPSPWAGWLHWWSRSLSFTVPQAALAAAALMAVAGVSVWWALGRGPIPATTRGPAIAVQSNQQTNPTSPQTQPAPGDSPAATAEVLALASIDPRYETTIAELRRILDQDRNRLDPKTVEVVENNLRIIDRALLEAQRAVAADPSNTYLRNHLVSMMKRKVNLMRTATLLAEPPQG